MGHMGHMGHMGKRWSGSLFFLGWIAASALGLTQAAAALDTVQLASGKDNTLYDDGASGALSNGLGVGVFSGVTNAGTVRRALVWFDLSAIPAGSEVTAVTLRLRITQTIAGPAETTLHRVLGAWGEGASGGVGAGGSGAPSADCDATWLHRYFPGAVCSDVRWVTPGGDFEAQPSAQATAGNLGTEVLYTGAALVADVQRMLDGAAPNEGWLVRHVDELTGLTAKRFGAREAPNASDRPALIVDYLPPTQQAFCAPGQPNSVSSAGSMVALVGSGSVGGNDNSLVVTGAPDQFGLFVQGDRSMPAVALPFGGSLCIGGTLGRFPVQVAVQGRSELLLNFAGSGIENATRPGETWWYQWVHRDTTPGGGNVSAGLAVTWRP